LRHNTTYIWPIDPAAAKRPDGWPRPPAGKKFSVALTHDVGGNEGLSRCRELARRERDPGFRSSFNFALQHDGHIFSSEGKFDDKAERINHHLRAWNAKGFRADFMLRNVDCAHALTIAHHSWTFDTDPFEPRPDCLGTIFPSWIPAPGTDRGVESRGYVELPDTLPQDSTLCVLHQEESNAIWRSKLEWVANHADMVLLNVHPDYLHFGGHGPSPQHTVLEHYLALLRFLQARFRNACWHALPREVAAFVQDWRRVVVSVST